MVLKRLGIEMILLHRGRRGLLEGRLMYRGRCRDRACSDFYRLCQRRSPTSYIKVLAGLPHELLILASLGPPRASSVVVTCTTGTVSRMISYTTIMRRT